jgi:predicted RND superfamily exporter protein
MAPDSFVMKEERTRYAVLHIGPPIIGSAFITLSTATFMLFVENQFSRKFGTILIITILQSMIGSFVVFFSLCDCFGPSKNNKFCSGSKNVPVRSGLKNLV